MTASEIGERIKQRRKLLRITQGDVARLASCSKPSVIAAESGKPTLRLDILLSILHVLGLTIHLDDAGAGQICGRCGAVSAKSTAEGDLVKLTHN